MGKISKQHFCAVALFKERRGEERKLSQTNLCEKRINENASELYNGFRLEKCNGSLFHKESFEESFMQHSHFIQLYIK